MGIGKSMRRDAGEPEHNRSLGWNGSGIGPIAQNGGLTQGIGNLMASFPGEGAYAVSGQTGLWYYRGAMSIPAFWRGARLLSFLFGGLNFDAYTTHGRNNEQVIDPRPMLLEQPNPPRPRVNTWSAAALDYLCDGNALFLIASRDSLGKATSVVPVPASMSFVRRVGQQGSTYTPTLNPGQLEYQVGVDHYGEDDVIHVMGLSAPGMLRGFGILEAHLAGTLHKAHLEAAWGRQLARPGVPPGYLQVTNDSAEANDPKSMRIVKNGWMDQRDEGGIAMLNNAVNFVPLSWNPDQMQMIQAREMTNLEIANLLSLPPRYVGASSGDPMTYSTSESEAQDLIKFSLNEILIPFEQTLSLEFARGTNVRANLDELMRGDRLARYQAYLIGREAGFLTPELIAEWEGIDPKDLPKDDTPSAAVQKGINKQLPVDQDGVKQVLIGDPNAPPAIPHAGQGTPGPGPLAPGVPPVKAIAARMDRYEGWQHDRAVSRLQLKPGTALWQWFTVGAGFRTWSVSPHPWQTIVDMVESHGVPPSQSHGEATNIMQATPAGRALFALHHKGGQ